MQAGSLGRFSHLSSGFLFALVSLLGFGQLAAAEPATDNWAQWRGPQGTGVAPTADPPIRWSDSENIKWKVKITGSGTATPIVWDNFVFVQSAIPTGKGDSEPPKQPNPPEKKDGDRSKGKRSGGMRSPPPTTPYQFVLFCLDRQTGKVVWQKAVREAVPHESHHRDHGFASHSPVTDGKHVYAYFGSRGLHCLDMEGNVKWSKDLGKMQTINTFGEGSSPALFGDRLVINWDHQGADFIAAFNALTGEEVWRKQRDENTSWATPLVVVHEGRPQVVTAATSKIRSYDLENGKLVWEGPGLTPNTIPSPVSSNGVVFAMSGFRGNALYAIRLGSSGDVTGTDAIVWKYGRSTPYVPSPLLYDNRLYFFSGNNAILSCFDAITGKPHYETQRLDGLQGVYASPVGAAGRVYLVGRNGVSQVIKHSDKLEVLGTNRLNDRIDASPAIAGKELYLRGHEFLYCISEK